MMSNNDNPLYTLINPNGFIADGTHQKTLEHLNTPEGSAAAGFCDEDGSTYLHRIAGAQGIDQEKLVPVIYQLACHGVDPNAQDTEGNTALHKCLKGKDSSWLAIQAFIRIGTDLTLENNVDHTPMKSIQDERLKSQVASYGDGLPAAMNSRDTTTVERLLQSWCFVPNVKKEGTETNDAIGQLYEKFTPTLEFVKHTLAADIPRMKKIHEEFGDKVDINTIDIACKDYWTSVSTPMPLFIAAMAPQLGKEVLETLLSFGPNLGMFYKGMKPAGPVMFTVENSTNKPSEEFAKLVLNQGDLSLKDNKGQTIAFHAGKRSTEYLTEVLKMGVDIWERDIQGHTLIDNAIFQGNDEEAKSLQNYVTDMISNAPNRNEKIATMSVHGFDCLFKAKGADGKTIKDLAIEREMTDVSQMLEMAEIDFRNVEKLMNGTKDGNLPLIKSILETDSKLAEYRDKSGRCALHQAVLFEQKDIFDKLIGLNKSLVSLKDNLGRTPLHYAAALIKGESFYSALVAAGADEDAKDWNNLSSKDYKRQMASTEGLEEVDYNVKEMIEYERSMKHGDAVLIKQNCNDLVDCIENQDIQGVQKLLNELKCPLNEIPKVVGASVDAVMFVCVRTGSEDIARLLIDTGADLEIFRENGMSLLDYARTLGMKDLHKLISQKIKEAHDAAMTPLNRQSTMDSLSSLEMTPILPEVRLRKLTPPSTIDARYLAMNVGDALEKALSEIVMMKPHDPIEYLARYLHTHAANLQYAKEQRKLKYELEKERIAEENERRRQKRRDMEAERIQQEEREKRREQKLKEEKEKESLAEQGRVFGQEEDGPRRERTEEKYAHAPDLATVSEDPREEDVSDRPQVPSEADDVALAGSGTEVPPEEPGETEQTEE